jgi:hypothetical protein
MTKHMSIKVKIDLLSDALNGSKRAAKILRALIEQRQRAAPGLSQIHAFKLRAPDRKTYTGTNLRRWCKTHEHLFMATCPPARRNASKPLWIRASQGLAYTRYPESTASNWFGWELLLYEKVNKKTSTT